MQPPPTKADIWEQVDAITQVVVEAGIAADRRWGVGRLPALVPIEWAHRFVAQRQKWRAVGLYDVDNTVKHGEAMVRAYAKLDEIAVAAGHQPIPPEQWEFVIPGQPGADASDDRLVILIKDIRQTAMVETHGRQCEVWSLDEIASVIRAQPGIAAVKQVIQGAVVQPMRERGLLDDAVPY